MIYWPSRCRSRRGRRRLLSGRVWVSSWMRRKWSGTGFTSRHRAEPPTMRSRKRRRSAPLCRRLLKGCALQAALAVALLPAAQTDYFQQALAKYQNRHYQEALPLAEQALRQDRNNSSYLHLYGLTLAALGQFSVAEDNLRRAVTLDPRQRLFHTTSVHFSTRKGSMLKRFRC